MNILGRLTTDLKTRLAPKTGQGGNWRLVLVSAGLTAAFGVVLVRAFTFQVLDSARLSALARQEHLQTVTLTPSRGIIYDRNRVELALSVQVESVYARPRRIREPKEIAPKLARILGLGQSQVLQALGSGQPFVWLRRQVSPDVSEKIQDLGLEGVGVVPESRRFYPHRHLAAHVLGFAGLDAQGLEGLEKGHDQLLKGRLSRVTRMRDAAGRPIYQAGAGWGDADDGHSLVLTLDKRVQYLAERALAQTVAKYQAKGGQVVVMKPATGEILALAVAPSFNPNVFGSYPRETWRNRAVADAFEPGSVMKVFTLAGILEAGLYRPESVINCEGGAYRVATATIHDIHPHQDLTLADVLAKSSNIGAAKLGRALGARELHKTLASFGFGRLTGLDLPGETAGLLRSAEKWGPVETATIAFGQGVAVTALQLCAAVSAVANQGIVMRPYLVKEVLDAAGRVEERRGPKALGRAIGPATARTLTDMMEGVVETGTGTQAGVAGYRVAGKTGTGQKPSPQGGYYPDKHVASFVGFAPADKPALAMAVVIDEPRGAMYGGTVAAPMFASLTQESLPLLGVPPSEDKVLRAAAPIKLTAKSVPAGLNRMRLTSSVPAGPERADVKAALDQGKMPELVGLSLRQALRIVLAVGLTPVIEGSGQVFDQEPKPGQDLKGVEGCRIRLKAEAS